MRPDRQAEYCEFVASHFTDLRRFGCLVCGDWHRAEDAVQTAMVKLYADWGRANRRSITAYTRRMVVNALHDVHRRSWFRRERSTWDPPDTALAAPSDAGEDRIVLLAALSRLPVRQRATLVLRFWEDRGVDETAEIMRCSISTVKSQTAKELRTLRKHLSGFALDELEGAAR